MSDITSTTFGYIIAFLLPGLAGLYGISFFSARLRGVFQTFLTQNSNGALLLLIVAASLAVGLVVGMWRHFLFEKLLCRKHCVDPQDFVRLDNPSKLTAYRAAIDETFRYHQFFGGIAVVLPVLYAGWLVQYLKVTNGLVTFLTVVVFILTECAVFIRAMALYRLHVTRAKSILADRPPVLKEDCKHED